ncbi:MAG: hypothetical protein JO112_20690, partial [Planctomycetes bacterium]|nr:hypothetical protein [Planctomycetota bacterium]
METCPTRPRSRRGDAMRIEVLGDEAAVARAAAAFIAAEARAAAAARG